jgi:hypothetical protein
VARVIKIDNPELYEKNNEIIIWGKKGIVTPKNALVLKIDGVSHIPHIHLNGIKYKYCWLCSNWIALCYYHNDKLSYDSKAAYCAKCVNERERIRYNRYGKYN